MGREREARSPGWKGNISEKLAETAWIPSCFAERKERGELKEGDITKRQFQKI